MRIPNIRVVAAAMTAAALVAAVAIVEAVDGVVLISQDRALAGDVTPGDASGFPVTISQPGSYRLFRNLTRTDATATVIDITADNATLALNGFPSSGPGGCGSRAFVGV